eukprot:4687114-Amphidinium_carterae.1
MHHPMAEFNTLNYSNLKRQQCRQYKKCLQGVETLCLRWSLTHSLYYSYHFSCGNIRNLTTASTSEWGVCASRSCFHRSTTEQ